MTVPEVGKLYRAINKWHGSWNVYEITREQMHQESKCVGQLWDLQLFTIVKVEETNEHASGLYVLTPTCLGYVLINNGCFVLADTPRL